MNHLVPLTVVVPMLGAAFIAGTSFLPRRLHEVVAIGCALGSTVMLGFVLAAAKDGPVVYWLGHWIPQHKVALGISLAADQLGTGIALLAGVLVVAALVYAAAYFEDAEPAAIALVLTFMAGMVGFSLTGDLFNMFVFFELMGVSAFALTAIRIEERGPIQGAINFAVTNSVAGFAMLVGIGLLYGRTGALNLAQIGQALDHHPADSLVAVAMLLIVGAFLTKAAAVPFHFWLADAHAVAPAPVSILFSGVMVELGVFGAARVLSTAFAQPIEPSIVDVRAVLVGLGTLTAVVAAVNCLQQRHLKRLLAFSTISHMGIAICGVGMLGERALAGAAAYALGHGLAKGSLFLGTGTLLHRFGSVDEFDLRGRGRALPVLGVVFAAGALVLASAPLMLTFFGKDLLDHGALDANYRWLPAVLALCGALTAAAVFRVTARVFLGWGRAEPATPGMESEEESQRQSAEEEGEAQKPRPFTPAILVVVPAVLMLLALVLGLVPDLIPSIERAAAHFHDHAAYATAVLTGHSPDYAPVPTSHVEPSAWIYSSAAVLVGLVVAAFNLRGGHVVPLRMADVMRAAHSGHVGDYIAWWTLGITILGGLLLWAVAG
jgi:multicomponent Na+:H+ antiporter subunit D